MLVEIFTWKRIDKSIFKLTFHKKTLFFAYAFPVRQLLKDTILKKQTYSQSFTLFNDENISN